MSGEDKGKSFSKTYSSKTNAIDNHIGGNGEHLQHRFDKMREAYYNGPPLTKEELEQQDKAFARSQRQLPRESLTEEESLRLMAWSEKSLKKREHPRESLTEEESLRLMAWSEKHLNKREHPRESLTEKESLRLLAWSENFLKEREQLPIQSKFEISAQHDASEKQADKIADELIEEGTLNLKPITENSLLRQTDEEENEADLNRNKLSDEVNRFQKSSSSSGVQVSPQVESGIKSMKGQGQSLSDSERSFFEPRFGADFSGVKIHNNANAAELADSIRAKAFTTGNDIFFNQGQYSPTSSEGKNLLAHELTHVVQQKKSSHSFINRAEVDTDSRSKKLKDCKNEINKMVNEALIEAREERKQAVNSNKRPLPIISYLYKLLGKNIEAGRTAIEVKIRKKPNIDKEIIKKADTKYKGVKYGLWKTAEFVKMKMLNPIINVNGIYMGTDKLGHFFQQGYQYYRKYDKAIKKERLSPNEAYSKMIKFGKDTEAGGFGLAMTGVRSNADLYANLKGFNFYKLLNKNPNLSNFDISKYVLNKDMNWDEAYNSNQYHIEVAKKVWINLLTKLSWFGRDKDFINDIILTFYRATPESVCVQVLVDDKKLMLRADITYLKKKYLYSSDSEIEGVTGILLNFYSWKSGAHLGTMESVKESLFKGKLQVDSQILNTITGI